MTNGTNKAHNSYSGSALPAKLQQNCQHLGTPPNKMRSKMVTIREEASFITVSHDTNQAMAKTEIRQSKSLTIDDKNNVITSQQKYESITDSFSTDSDSSLTKNDEHDSKSINGDDLEQTIDDKQVFQLDKNNNVHWNNLCDACHSDQDSIDLD